MSTWGTESAVTESVAALISWPIVSSVDVGRSFPIWRVPSPVPRPFTIGLDVLHALALSPPAPARDPAAECRTRLFAMLDGGRPGAGNVPKTQPVISAACVTTLSTALVATTCFGVPD